MWKIFHKLFGWKYAVVTFAFDKVVVRMKQSYDGKLYYRHHGVRCVNRKTQIHMWLTEPFEDIKYD